MLDETPSIIGAERRNKVRATGPWVRSFLGVVGIGGSIAERNGDRRSSVSMNRVVVDGR